MNVKTKTGFEILEAAVLLGILGDALLRSTRWGLNIFLWVSLLVTAMIAITIRRKRADWNPRSIALHGALILFSAMFVWRDSRELSALNVVAMLTILAILTLPTLKIKVHVAGISHYVVSMIWLTINVAFSPLILLMEDIKWKALPKNRLSNHLFSIVKGLAIAAPILLVFGGLFMAADAVFQGIIEETFRINPDIVLTHLGFFGLIAWIAAGYLRATAFDFASISEAKLTSPGSKEMKRQILSVTVHTPEDAIKSDGSRNETEKSDSHVEPKDTANESKTKTKDKKGKDWDWRKLDDTVLPGFLTLGFIEISIVLGLMNLLFLGFVLVQIPYLFGGMELVQTTPDFKLAEYARRGFGELVTVSALVLPILLLSHWLLRKNKPINEKIYRILAGVQIALLFVIMVSATQRLLLLTGNLGYGLTTVRFYPMAFMVLLALIFVWFSITVLRGAREQFAWGTVWLTLFMLATLHVMNPDDFIVRTNIGLMKEGRNFDSYYNSNLSSDAIPALIDSLPLMDAPNRNAVISQLNRQRCFSIFVGRPALQKGDIRSWNWSRAVAITKLKHDPRVVGRGCENPPVNVK